MLMAVSMLALLLEVLLCRLLRWRLLLSAVEVVLRLTRDEEAWVRVCALLLLLLLLCHVFFQVKRLRRGEVVVHRRLRQSGVLVSV